MVWWDSFKNLYYLYCMCLDCNYKIIEGFKKAGSCDTMMPVI